MPGLFDTMPNVTGGPVPRPYQVECLSKIDEAFRTSRSTLAVMATGTGKCLAAGTPVLMYDGTIRNVEHVEDGELVMGPDSLPRKVVGLAHGRSAMYRVTPTKGEAYTVNEAHILSFRVTGLSRSRYGWNAGDVINISVLEYLALKKSVKHLLKGWRTGVDFEPTAVPIDPYFLGLWLADGSSKSPTLWKPDAEVRAAAEEVAASFGLKVRVEEAEGKCPGYHIVGVRKKENPLTAAMRSLGLLPAKFVPLRYKVNCRKVRLAVLAGLLDGDGSASCGGFDYVSIIRELAKDVAYLARSLGFAAYVKKCVKSCQTGAVGIYWRVGISGDCREIPTRIPRKQLPARKQKKDVCNVGIEVEPVGEGDYYGFELEGPDRLFLLGDFTVTHNTVVFGHQTANWLAARPDERVLVLAHRDELIRQAAGELSGILGWVPDIEQADSWASVNGRNPSRCVVASVQTLFNKKRLERFDPKAYTLIVCDECFPSGTLVDDKPIETIKAGDWVTAFDENSGTTIRRRVVRTFDNPASAVLIRVTAGGRSVIATPNHPFWVDGQWVPAIELSHGMNLTIQGDRDDRLFAVRESGIEDRSGGGWELSQHQTSEGRGRQEDGTLVVARVDRVEVLEPGRDGTFGGVCAGGRVYNLEVEGEHTYFANGFVVHNCHHNVESAATYRRIRQHFPDAYELGVTATAQRGDKIALGGTYAGGVCFEYGIREAIQGGWLVDVEQEFVRVKSLDLSEVGTTKGDFNQKQLSLAMTHDMRVGWEIAAAVIERCQNEPTLIFSCPRPAGEPKGQGEQIFEALNSMKPGSAVFLTGEHHPDDRKRQLQRFENGEYPYLVGCSLFTEGFNSPGIANVVMARQTKSIVYYTQAIGRGTRTLRGLLKPEHNLWTPDERRVLIAASAKPRVRVLDFVGNSGKHKLISCVDIFAGSVAAQAKAKSKKPKDGEARSVLADLKKAEREVEIEDTNRKARVKATVDVQSERVDPFGYTDNAGRHKPIRKQSDPATPDQMEFIRSKGGIAPKGKLTVGEAGKVIADIKDRWNKRLCSQKQEKMLKNLGMADGPVPKNHAKAMIDFAAAKNFPWGQMGPVQRSDCGIRKQDGGFQLTIQGYPVGEAFPSIEHVRNAYRGMAVEPALV